MSEYHMELSTYIHCEDTQRLIDAIVVLCESEGMRRIAYPPTALWEMDSKLNIADVINYWTMAILQGREGWHSLLSIPQDLLCERPIQKQPNRFLKLCQALQSEGLIIDSRFHSSSYKECAEVYFEVDDKGSYAISGYDERSSKKRLSRVKNRFNWYGYAIPEGNEGLQLLQNKIPAILENIEPYYSDIEQAHRCYKYASLFLGESIKYWEGRLSWERVYTSLCFNAPELMPDAVFLTFEWPALNRQYPNPVEKSKLATYEFMLAGYGYNGFDKPSDFYWLSRSARDGDMAAQYYLAVCYRQGTGTAVDEASSIYWYQQSAEQGYNEAQFALGIRYQLGQGVAKNDTQSFNWYLLAAEQGNSKAQNNVGDSYEKGRGITQDFQKAQEWYTKAALQNLPHAQYNLGMLYKNGIGLEANLETASKWFEKAAAKGYSNAITELAKLKG